MTATAALANDTPLGVVHYQLDGRLIHVPVTVEGTTLWFDVDTGARHTVVDTATARALHMVAVRNDVTHGAGVGPVPLRHAEPIDLTLGGVRMRIADPWIVDLSHVGTGRHIDGLVGVDFLKAYVVRIDPVAQTIALYDQRGFRTEGTSTKIPLRVQDNRIFIAVGLFLSNGLSAISQVRVDTGSDDAVSDNFVRQSPTRMKSVEGIGLGQPYVDYSGVFSKVQIGPYAIRNVWGPANDHPAVGMEILRRFTMTLSIASETLYLTPNKHLNDPVPTPGS